MQDSTGAFPMLKSRLSERVEGTSRRNGAALAVRSHLEGCIRRVEDLTRSERGQMYSLLANHFANVTRSRFECDLSKKEWVCIGTDSSSGEIRGFSTLMRFDAVLDDRPVVALFSGDTIVSREHWQQTAFPRIMGRHMFDLAQEVWGARVFWLLICSGYKTYRFLPVFFREFYPRFEVPTPPDFDRLINALAHMKFGTEYDPLQGIVRFAEPTPLRPGVADIDEQRLRDPHVAFFLRANPGYVSGDELVCVTELTLSNLTSAGQRVLGNNAR